MCYYTESLMIRKACEETLADPKLAASVIKLCLKHWKDNHMIEHFSKNLEESLRFAVQKDRCEFFHIKTDGFRKNVFFAVEILILCFSSLRCKTPKYLRRV